MLLRDLLKVAACRVKRAELQSSFSNNATTAQELFGSRGFQAQNNINSLTPALECSFVFLKCTSRIALADKVALLKNLMNCIDAY